MNKEKPFGKILWVALAIAVAAMCFGLKQWRSQEPRISVYPENRFSDTIVVAADSDYQPYSFLDDAGNPAGYDIELIYLLANKMQRNVEIRLMQWGDAQKAVQSGEADVLMGLDYNLEALAQYELSLPLDNDPFVAFGTKSLASIDDLAGKRIATLENGGGFAAFLTPYRLESYTTTYPSYGEAFQSVVNGENDYAIAMYSVGRRAIANMENPAIKAIGPTLAGNYLCIGTKRGNTALMNELDSAIVQLKKEGAIDSLGSKWLGRYVEVISFGDYIQKNSTTIVFLLLLLVVLSGAAYVTMSRRLAKSTALQYETVQRVLQYQKLLTEATKGLYENIYELDITHNCAGGESTKQYFESLGIPGDTPYDAALHTIAEKQIKEEYIQGYIETFSPAHVLRTYQSGVDRLSYDFMITYDGKGYYWMRIMARIFYWTEDKSIRMIIYRQNIDAEKKKEQALEQKAREDPLTGLYNKTMTAQLVGKMIEENPNREYAFLMLDIDHFKNINDTLGHAFGDYVIVDFANELKKHAEPGIAGRVGGDEFAIFFQTCDPEWVEEKAESVIRAVSREIKVDGNSCTISASMGIACYPQDGVSFEQLYRKADQALYHTKKHGRNGFTFCGDSVALSPAE